MAVSVIELCNNALLDMGEDPILALTDDSRQARLCAQRWPAVRDAVLRAHPWNCATRQAALPASTEQPGWKWDFAYVLPPDLLRLLRVSGSSGRSLCGWEVQAGRILTDETAPLYIEYVRRENDPQRYDALLSETLSARMAAVLAYALTGSTSLEEAMWRLYQQKLAEARGVDAREGGVPVAASENWVAVKYGGGR